MDLLLATSNEGKREEFQKLLKNLPESTITCLPEDYNSPEENGSTLLENALIKAKAAHLAFPSKWILADDTGLFVPYLNGAPGIHTARYSGNKNPEANRKKLMQKLEGAKGPNRIAYFHCSLLLLSPKNDAFAFHGVSWGHITPELKTKPNKLCYDCLFIPQGYEKSFAELSLEKKAQISHRSQACALLSNFLKQSPLPQLNTYREQCTT